MKELFSLFRGQKNVIRSVVGIFLRTSQGFGSGVSKAKVKITKQGLNKTITY